MHSPDLSLEDVFKADSLNKMVSFLETVQCRMKETYGDVSQCDCEDAVANIKKVSSAVLSEFECLLRFCEL